MTKSTRYKKSQKEAFNGRHILGIIGWSLGFKIAFLVFSYFVLFTGLDMFDLNYYYEHGILLLSGHLPYFDFSFDYPPIVFIPILLSLVLSNNFVVFVSLFNGIMILCDLVTALCVYFIALEVFNKDSTAFKAAIIYSTSLELAYFTFTKFDAFPTMVLMVALLLTLKSDRIKGYYALVVGGFTKIFPVITGPFVFLYNASKSDPVKEIKSLWPVVIAPCTVLAAISWVTLSSVSLGTGATGSWSRGAVYVNTIEYTVFALLHDAFGISDISPDQVATCGYVLMVSILLYLVYYAYRTPQTPQIFIKIVLAALFTFVALWSYHSPQYLFWYMPLIAILIVNNVRSIILYYVVQIVAFIEFPKAFSLLWVNDAYRATLGQAPQVWWLTWGMFAVFQAALVYLVYMALTSEPVVVP